MSISNEHISDVLIVFAVIYLSEQLQELIVFSDVFLMFMMECVCVCESVSVLGGGAVKRVRPDPSLPRLVRFLFRLLKMCPL